MSYITARRMAFLGATCLPLQAMQLQVSIGPGKTVAEVLSERGVGQDRDSLMKALKTSDELTQSYAAEELAEQHVVDAEPYIAEAFHHAGGGVARFNLAQALMRFNADTGKKALLELCHDNRLDSALQLRAVRLMREANSHDCDSAIAEVIMRSEDPSVKLSALSLLGNPESTNDLQKTIALEGRLLNDENNAVRMAAGYMLIATKSEAARKLITKRLEVETTPEVKRSLRMDLSSTTESPQN